MSTMDILRLPEYLGHIVQAIDRVHRYVADMHETGFLQDEKTQDAVIRNFEVIGEASNNIKNTTPLLSANILQCRLISLMKCAMRSPTDISK